MKFYTYKPGIRDDCHAAPGSENVCVYVWSPYTYTDQHPVWDCTLRCVCPDKCLRFTADSSQWHARLAHLDLVLDTDVGERL